MERTSCTYLQIWLELNDRWDSQSVKKEKEERKYMSEKLKGCVKVSQECLLVAAGKKDDFL